VGVNQSQYSRVESGKRRASPELANRIAKYFGNAVTRDQVLYPEDYEEVLNKPLPPTPAAGKPTLPSPKRSPTTIAKPRPRSPRLQQPSHMAAGFPVGQPLQAAS